MAKFTTSQTWADGDQVTATKLTAIVGGLSLSTDSVDGSTITQVGGELRLGTAQTANLANSAVTTVKVADEAITTAKLATDAVATAKIADSAVTAAKVAADAVAWTKTLTADRAVQADMQSETAAHFVSPDVLKYHPGIAKAYGTVAFENGMTTVTGGYNVTSASDTGTGREITLAVTMANANYVVTATGNGGGAQFDVTGKTTTKFTLSGPAEAASRTVSFVVHGQLAT